MSGAFMALTPDKVKTDIWSSQWVNKLVLTRTHGTIPTCHSAGILLHWTTYRVMINRSTNLELLIEEIQINMIANRLHNQYTIRKMNQRVFSPSFTKRNTLIWKITLESNQIMKWMNRYMPTLHSWLTASETSSNVNCNRAATLSTSCSHSFKIRKWSRPIKLNQMGLCSWERVRHSLLKQLFISSSDPPHFL